MTRSRWIIALLFLPVSLVFLFLGLYNSKAQRQSLETIPFQERERAIMKKTDFDPPVSIKAVKTKGRSVPFDERFIDEDDWLKGFTVSVRNDSRKIVTHIGVRMLFRPTDERTEYPAEWILDYGPNPFFFKTAAEVLRSPLPNLLPGGELELKLDDNELEDLKVFLKKVGFSDKIHVVEVVVTTIGFTDGTAWNGKMFKRGAGRGEWKRVDTTNSQLYNHFQGSDSNITGHPAEFFSSNNLSGVSLDNAGSFIKYPIRLR